LRRRVRHFERQRWAAMGGQDEMELIRDLPDALRRDIKRYLCKDLIKKVTSTSIYIYKWETSLTSMLSIFLQKRNLELSTLLILGF
jgi:hypothetical protein